MDYIIFGIGSSATLVLTGWLLRDWGPRLRDRKPPEDEILSASDLVVRMAWARFCAACGMAILICGILVMLVTLGAAFFAPSDRAAAIAVVAAFGLAAVLMLLWTSLYLRQFGAIGVLRPREKPASTESSPAQAEVPTTTPAVEGVTGVPETAPSFAQTTAARGGLGRFAAFFRKEPAPAQDAPTEAPVDAGLAAAPAASTPDVAESAPAPLDPSPTDAVIAELTGELDTEDDKSLSPDDALVTSVRGDAVAAAGERAARMDAAQPAPPVADDDAPAATEGDAAVTGPTDQELALAQLRRRRMSRLTHPSEPD